MLPISTVSFSIAAKTCIRQPEGLDLEFKRRGHTPGEILPCVLGLSTGSEKQCSLSNFAFHFKSKHTQ